LPQCALLYTRIEALLSNLGADSNAIDFPSLIKALQALSDRFPFTVASHHVPMLQTVDLDVSATFDVDAHAASASSSSSSADATVFIPAIQTSATLTASTTGSSTLFTSVASGLHHRVKLVQFPEEEPPFMLDWMCLLRMALQQVPKSVMATVHFVLDAALAGNFFPGYVWHHFHAIATLSAGSADRIHENACGMAPLTSRQALRLVSASDWSLLVALCRADTWADAASALLDQLVPLAASADIVVSALTAAAVSGRTDVVLQVAMRWLLLSNGPLSSPLPVLGRRLLCRLFISGSVTSRGHVLATVLSALTDEVTMSAKDAVASALVALCHEGSGAVWAPHVGRLTEFFPSLIHLPASIAHTVLRGALGMTDAHSVMLNNVLLWLRKMLASSHVPERTLAAVGWCCLLARPRLPVHVQADLARGITPLLTGPVATVEFGLYHLHAALYARQRKGCLLDSAAAEAVATALLTRWERLSIAANRLPVHFQQRLHAHWLGHAPENVGDESVSATVDSATFSLLPWQPALTFSERSLGKSRGEAILPESALSIEHDGVPINVLCYDPSVAINADVLVAGTAREYGFAASSSSSSSSSAASLVDGHSNRRVMAYHRRESGVLLLRCLLCLVPLSTSSTSTSSVAPSTLVSGDSVSASDADSASYVAKYKKLVPSQLFVRLRPLWLTSIPITAAAAAEGTPVATTLLSTLSGLCLQLTSSDWTLQALDLFQGMCVVSVVQEFLPFFSQRLCVVIFLFRTAQTQLWLRHCLPHRRPSAVGLPRERTTLK
jgi:hypothetical protein